MTTWHLRLAIAFAIGAVIARPAAAADLWVIGSTDDKLAYFFADASTIAPVGAGIQSMSIYEVLEGADIQKANAKYFVMTVYFNCAAHELSSQNITVYDVSGNVAGQQNIANPQYQSASGNSTGGMELTFACTPPSSWTPTFAHLAKGTTPVEAADILYKSNSPSK